MKKTTSILVVVCLFLLLLVGCGNAKSSSNSIMEDMIQVSVRDVKQNLDQFSRHVAELTNVTDKYLTGIVIVYAIDQDKNKVGETTLFLNNLAPADYVGHSILVPFIEGVDFGYEIVRLETSEKATKTPEITDENLHDYVYLTYKDYNDIFNNKKKVAVDINNLTTQYMSGKVVITAKDQNGTVLTKRTEQLKNINPYSSEPFVLLFDIVDNYTIEYVVQGYSFTDNPIS